MGSPRSRLLSGLTLLVIGCGEEPTPGPAEAATEIDAPAEPIVDEEPSPVPVAPEPPPPDPVTVLYLADKPTWEYRYLKNALVRTDAVVEMQAYLFDASTTFHQERSRPLPSLTGLPRTVEELAAYDVILIGDVPPERLGATEAERETWLDRLEQFVESGGGVGFLAGPQAMPESYRGTAVEEMLPVLLEETPARERRVDGDFRLEPADAGHPVAKLLDDPARNRELWRRGFPGIQSYYPVQGTGEGAEIVLQRLDEGNATGPSVIAAMGSHGRGRTFFLATDETWRWRNPYGERHYDTFWKNVVLALGRDR